MSYKAPTEDDRCTSAFVTWSKPKIAHGHWMRPGERKEFAKMIADTLDGLETERRGPKQEKAARIECGVFKEPHEHGGFHLHAILVSDRKTTLWAQLGAALRSKYRAACDVRVGTGRGVNHFNRMVRYVMVPTESKWILDEEPFVTPNFNTPPDVSPHFCLSFFSLSAFSAFRCECILFLKECTRRTHQAIKRASTLSISLRNQGSVGGEESSQKLLNRHATISI